MITFKSLALLTSSRKLKFETIGLGVPQLGVTLTEICVFLWPFSD